MTLSMHFDRVRPEINRQDGRSSKTVKPNLDTPHNLSGPQVLEWLSDYLRAMDPREDAPWRKIIESARVLDRIAWPQSLLMRAIERAEEAAKGGRSRWLVASCTFDNAATVAIEAGGPTRGNVIDGRQLFYAAEEKVVALNMFEQGQERSVNILGQFFESPSVLAGANSAQLIRQSAVVDYCRIDRFGEFEFTSVDPGTYSVALEADRFSVLIPEIELVD